MVYSQKNIKLKQHIVLWQFISFPTSRNALVYSFLLELMCCDILMLQAQVHASWFDKFLNQYHVIYWPTYKVSFKQVQLSLVLRTTQRNLDIVLNLCAPFKFTVQHVFNNFHVFLSFLVTFSRDCVTSVFWKRAKQTETLLFVMSKMVVIFNPDTGSVRRLQRFSVLICSKLNVKRHACINLVSGWYMIG